MKFFTPFETCLVSESTFVLFVGEGTLAVSLGLQLPGLLEHTAREDTL